MVSVQRVIDSIVIFVSHVLLGIILLIAMVIAFGGIFGGLAVFGYQVYLWLYTGEWFPFSLADLWPPPYWSNGWIGVHKAVVWFMGMSVALVLFFGGIIASGICEIVENVREALLDED